MNRQTRTRPTKREIELLEQLELRLTEEKKGENNIGRISSVEEKINKLKYTSDIFNEKEKISYIKEMMSNAFHMKSDVYQDRHIAETQYKNILEIDRENPEAFYRYAYLQYDKRNWLEAIIYFQNAIKAQTNPQRNINFPLSEDQIIKAQLYIGYCAAQLAKDTLNEANTLNKESLALPVEGISIEQLLNNLKAEINKTEFMMITNNEERGISKVEYERLLDNLDGEQLVLSFVEDRPFIQRGEDAENPLTGTLSDLLKRLLIMSKKDLALSLNDLDELGLKWNTYSQRVVRLNAALHESGYARTLIKAIPGRERYKIDLLDFYIVAREDHSL